MDEGTASGRNAAQECPTDYWETVAEEKTFSHPLDLERLERYAGAGARILDVGCGYGRIGAELAHSDRYSAGAVVGIDPAAAMIARGRREHPGLDLRHGATRPLPFASASFDVALLFAVLTSVPVDDEQRGLVAEVRRVLRQGGLVIVSDLELQAGERHARRYAEGERELGTRGVFRLPDGGVCRHHTPEHLRKLLGGFERLERVELDIVTMNGNPARAVQLYARRR